MADFTLPLRDFFGKSTQRPAKYMNSSKSIASSWIHDKDLLMEVALADDKGDVMEVARIQKGVLEDFQFEGSTDQPF